MASNKLRIEVYIPTLYNPDEKGNRKPIETNKKRKVKNEIIEKYGTISMHPSIIEGIWVNPSNKIKYYDSCKKFEICIDPKEDIEEELEKWKEELKNLFEQFEIFMIYYGINQV